MFNLSTYFIGYLLSFYTVNTFIADPEFQHFEARTNKKLQFHGSVKEGRMIKSAN